MADNTDSFWSDISQLTGQAAKGAASGRAQEGAYNNARDAIAAKLYDISQGAASTAAGQNLTADKFRTSLPSQGANESVRGSLIQNAQDAHLNLGTSHITPMEFSGGTRPSSYTPATRQAGADLQAHGAREIADPSSFITKTPGSGVAGASFLTPPALTPTPTAGFWGDAAGATSLTTGLLSALAKAGGGSGGGGDIGSGLAALKKLIVGGPSGIDGSGNTEDTRTEVPPQPVTGGVAYGPDGQPLPVDSGGYYDDATGQYIDNSAGGGTGDSGGDWWNP